MRSSFVLSAALLFLGCGSSTEGGTVPADTGTTADATTDAKTDSSSKTDGAVADSASDVGEDTKGVKCGDTTCGGGQVCCATSLTDGGVSFGCASSCPDGGGLVACDGPEDCPAGSPICCAEVDVSGTSPACTFKNGVTECRSTCTSNIPLTCPTKATARPCHKASDCPEPGYASCCEFEGSGTSATFCASDTMKLLAIGCF